MMLPIWILFAATAALPASSPDTRVAQAAQLFDGICLHAFPDDASVDETMRRMGATPMTPEQTKVTLRDDPGRGWIVPTVGSPYLVFLELPPFHACSVRWSMSETNADLAPYRALIDRAKAARPGFKSVGPYDSERGDIHIHAVGDQRDMPEGGAETFFVFTQHIVDPARRARGETATNWRFVRQFSPVR